MRVLTLSMLLGFSSGFLAPQKCIIDLGNLSHRQELVRLDMISSLTDFFFPPKSEPPSKDDSKKEKLLNLLAQVEPNKSTSNELTNDILNAVVELEKECPTLNEDVLPSIAGNWELIWTAQDRANMPTTNREQANFLEIGSTLWKINLIVTIHPEERILFCRKIFKIIWKIKNGKTQGFITVDVKGNANDDDPRRIDVKFDQFRVAITNSPIDITLPLGVIGPTGWLRTGYVDDDIRITRGHKGSVFILSKPSARSKK